MKNPVPSVSPALPDKGIDPPKPQASSTRRLAIGISALLAVLVCLVFGRTFHYTFVNYDDGDYVYENPHITKGLTSSGIKWVFTHSHGSNWHPLTGISHMLDCQLSQDPGWYHVTNVLLHAAAAVLLFLAFWRMTGALWPCAFAAAVFAIHPLRVESVAWISERKDVLSGLFFSLTLLAYARYAQKPWSLPRYLAVLVSCALGLMSKPTLVTVPFLLLLLDYWPLNRLALLPSGPNTPQPVTPPPARLIVEKIPLFILSAACCWATVWAQKGAIESVEVAPWSARIANALVSYVIYIRQMLYPAGLAVFYPRLENGAPASQVIVAVILLAAISAAAFLCRKKRPYFIIGWLWYLGMLVPVIGLMQVGLQSHADRYTYLPQIGLYLLIACLIAELCAGMRNSRAICGIGGLLVVAALGITASRQVRYWRDSGALWLRDLACATDNPIAHNNYGFYLFQEGHEDGAIAQYREALKLWPGYADAHADLALALSGKKEYEEALKHYAIALQINPDLPEVHNNIANIYFQDGDYEMAFSQCKEALAQKPDYADALCTMAMTLDRLGRTDEAIAGYEKSIAIRPDSAKAQNNYAVLLERLGKLDDAILHYRKALELEPGYMDADCNLAMALEKNGDDDEAAVYFRQAQKLSPASAEIHNDAANIFSHAGFKDAAIAQYEEALRINPRYAEAHYNLAIDLTATGDIEGAVLHYKKAMEIDPSDIRFQCNLAWILATASVPSVRNGTRAIELAWQANENTGGNNPAVLRTLAAAYAAEGRFTDALTSAQKALDLATAQSQEDMVATLRREMQFYHAGSPLRQPPGN